LIAFFVPKTATRLCFWRWSNNGQDRDGRQSFPANAYLFTVLRWSSGVDIDFSP